MKHNYLLHIGLLMAMLLLPMAAWGQTTLDISTGTITFESGGYTQENGSSGSDQNGYIITQTETMTSNIIFVKGGTYNITLDGVNIRAISSNRDTYSAFDLRSSSTVNLTLKGNNTLEAASSRDNNPGYRYAALSVPKDNTLTITDQSTGTLSAKGGMYIDSRNTTVYGAGIGGS